MAAPKGNRFWELRSSHGRKPKFATPGDLWNACVEYFEWNEKNPLYETKVFHYQGDITEHEAPKMRAMTLMGLRLFLDIDNATWLDYSKKEDFSAVCAAVMDVIRKQKFEGAAADLLNPAIIARDLGLADKHEHGGTDGGPLTVTIVEHRRA